MSSNSKGPAHRSLELLPAMLAFLFVFSNVAAAQDQPAPKWEFYGGYSFLYPNSDVHGQLPNALFPLTSRMETNPRGAGAALTYNFSDWFGLTLDYSTHWGSGESTVARRIDDAAFTNLSLGPKITFRHDRLSPFVEVLVGDHRLMPDAFHDIDKLGVMLGGGLDISLTRHVAWRLFRADYVMSNYRFGPPGVSDTGLRALRAQTGLNFTWGGGEPPLAPSASCTVEPAEIFAGESVTVHATPSNFSAKRTVTYSWSGTGVKVSGSNDTAQVDTTGLEPGSYTATANLSDGRKKNGTATCGARFTVKQPRPPVISCVADPTVVPPNAPVTIRSTANSPDGRKLTYTYSATAGEIPGNGESVTLNTRGANPGQITITCNVSDDHTTPLTASATTVVNVEAPPAPPPPQPAPEQIELEGRLALHSIYFPTAKPSAGNPQEGLVPSQADILEKLSRDFVNYLKYKADARVTLTGHADERGSEEYNKALTQRRVDVTKNYLVEHGVPADRIETQAMGKDQQLTATQIQEQLNQDPDLTREEKQQMLSHLKVMVLANNRRVDVTLNATGQQSVRRYPFNAKDYLALINPKGGEKKAPVRRKPATRKPATKRQPSSQ
jgi:outer membrane protein OmpA-like peptidoglycan-associated protein